MATGKVSLSPEEALWRLLQFISMLRLSTTFYSKMDLQMKMYAFIYQCNRDGSTCWYGLNSLAINKPHCCECIPANSKYNSIVVKCSCLCRSVVLYPISEWPTLPLELLIAGMRRVFCSILCVIVLLLLVKGNQKSSLNTISLENSVVSRSINSSSLIQPHLESEAILLSRNAELRSFTFNDAMKSTFINVRMPNLHDLRFSIQTTVDVTILRKRLFNLCYRLFSLSYIKSTPIFASRTNASNKIRNVKKNVKTFQISLLGGPNEGYCAIITVGKDKTQEVSIIVVI